MLASLKASTLLNSGIGEACSSLFGLLLGVYLTGAA